MIIVVFVSTIIRTINIVDTMINIDHLSPITTINHHQSHMMTITDGAREEKLRGGSVAKVPTVSDVNELRIAPTLLTKKSSIL